MIFLPSKAQQRFLREARFQALQLPCYSTKQEESSMTYLIQLSDAEIAAVAGGAISQTGNANYNSQTNTSTVTQTATATNSGNVTATASGYGSLAAAAGAEASNYASVSQRNSISVSNSVRFHH
jgi:hypothetical protein